MIAPMPKILLVEDNELNRDMLSRRLTRNGFEIIIAIDGQQGVELLRGDEVRCCRSTHTVKLVRLGDGGFFDVLRSKLSWGEL